MAKLVFPMLLLLQMISATHAAASGGQSTGGLAAACKRTAHVQFCLNLLQPYASQFEDNDPHKMRYAAISATLARAQSARAFLVRQTTEPETSDAERAVLKQCLDRIGEGVKTLHVATGELDKMRGAKGDERENLRRDVVKRVSSSSDGNKACYDLLKKGGGRIDGQTVAVVGREVEEAAKASAVALAFIIQ